MFSCDNGKIFKSNYFDKHLPTAASSINHVLQLVIFLNHFVIGLFNEVQYWIIQNQFISLFGTTYSRIDLVKIVEDNLQKILSDMIFKSRPYYYFKFFKGCLLQILLWSNLEYLVPFSANAPSTQFSASHYFVSGISTQNELKKNV